jgi:predicted transposase/invertase (TIGR01784 family)
MKKLTSYYFIKAILLVILITSPILPNDADGMPPKRAAAKEAGDSDSDSPSKPLHKGAAVAKEADTADAPMPASAALPDIALDHKFARAVLDTSFKHMLIGDEDRTPLLSFLKAFTGLNVTSVEHYPTAFPVLKESKDVKQTFLDLACQDDQGRFFIIEVQLKKQEFWDKRALYYASGVYSNQLASGAPWDQLRPVIAINILNHDRKTLPDSKYLRDFQLLDRENLTSLKPGVDLTDPSQIPFLRIIQCELPRADLNTMTDCPLRQWLQLLKESETLTDIPPGVEDPIRKAYERLEFEKWTPGMKQEYKSDMLGEQLPELLEQKHREGIEAGVLEGKKMTALGLLAQEVDIDIISKATGFSREEIELLRSSTGQ